MQLSDSVIYVLTSLNPHIFEFVGCKIRDVSFIGSIDVD